MARATSLARGAILLACSFAYLGSVFQLWGGAFWSAGIGDWMDPYFINYLLEHWYYSVRTFANPASPPMFHPATGTLGYSHGLILFAPFYIPARLFLHPLQAHNLTLLLVILTGILSLYVVLHRFLRVTVVESALLTAFFAGSANVMNGPLGVWSQRVSVFLVPSILLLILAAVHAPPGARQVVLSFAAGITATLLFTQDFYSAQFTFLFAAALAAPLVFEHGPLLAGAFRRTLERATPWARLALVAAALIAAWTLYVAASGGVSLVLFGIGITSTDWRRPAIAALLCLAVFLGLRGRIAPLPLNPAVRRWLLPLALGALAGAAVFLWIYVPAYREFPGFPRDAFTEFLVRRDSPAWRAPLAFLRSDGGFETLRPFLLVLAFSVLAWMPRIGLDWRTRLHVLWFLLLSGIVFLVPFRFGEFSIWGTVFNRLPGFHAIRDPLRIAYQYELAVTIAAGLLLSRMARGSAVRITGVSILLALVVVEPNRLVFDFERPNHEFDRWVAAPVRVDPSCRSFFVASAPPEYTARSREPGMLYSIDSMFISLRYSIPTLHGYSAWTPTAWRVGGPQDPGFAQGLADWVALHGLQDVCELDLERRTIGPARRGEIRQSIGDMNAGGGAAGHVRSETPPAPAGERRTAPAHP